jgi:hypothetical protein
MTPTQFYDHVVREFPATWPTDPKWAWVNVHDGVATKFSELRAVLDRHIPSPVVVVLVHSNPGVAVTLNKESACRYIDEHILQHEIQVADPRFESIVLVGVSGVATGCEARSRPGRSAAANA